MSDDEAQHQPEVSPTMPIDKADSLDNNQLVNSDDMVDNDVHNNSGRRSPAVPPSPPSPGSNDAETKLSRKREREVSLEPALGPGAKTSTITDSTSSFTATQEKDYIHTPTKKNRIQRSPELDATAEEDDVHASHHHHSHHRSRSNSTDISPPATQADLGISGSPPQEMKIKVRQISQGVEDLTWRNLKKQSGEEDPDDTIHEDAIPATEEDKNMDDDVVPLPHDQTSSSSSHSASGRDSDSNSNTDGTLNLKRKYIERGPSAEPPSQLDTSASLSNHVASVSVAKRPRDDAQKDDNPRETKRPTPPPPETDGNAVSSAKPAASGGFMAYASTSSPFASVKGQNIFSSTLKSSSSAIKIPLPSSPVLGAATATAESSSSSSAGTKRTGFEAFASSSSPFASVARTKSPVLGTGTFGSSSAIGGGVRAKSPTRRPAGSSHSVFGSSAGASSGGAGSSAFTAYASGGAQGFALPLTKRARGNGDSSESSTLGGSVLNDSDVFTGGDVRGRGGDSSRASSVASFGEKLRAASSEEKDEDSGEPEWDEAKQKVMLSEQEVSTGEELEETIHQVRGKLFALVDGAWKERGTGLMKINVRADDGGGARLVMRKEAVYTLLLNVTLFPGMKCTVAQDPRYVRFSVIEGSGVTTHYNLRLANAKIASELMEAVHENLPSK
ncbi:hypothetical protein BDP27DRAFT_1340774 [Rhodocollybia butyracea]|uniref:RanBD1 domain-containing protein n=1 Tax=Rhodocollybia butyracea TaxID=206335 RepID=A0A9P5P7L4_9AGAR|nr:hypothetical protein BDP27DRAFT_1340774 [Rhodocollybia butyracea]